MSQAVLLSEAYGEKVTSSLILISIITLWRAFIFLCLRPSLTPPCFSAFLCPSLTSGSQTTCWVLNLQERCRWAETRWCISGRGNGRASLEEFSSLYTCAARSGATTESTIQMLSSSGLHPRSVQWGQQWLQGSNRLLLKASSDKYMFKTDSRAVIIIRQLFRSITLSCFWNMRPSYQLSPGVCQVASEY